MKTLQKTKQKVVSSKKTTIMKAKMNILKAMIIAVVALFSSSAFAQRYYHKGRFHSNRSAWKVMVSRPATVVNITYRLSKQDRLNMALAYIRAHNALSISQYSKITGLKIATAEAELDAFAASHSNPIKMILNGKKKLYVV